jgi:hypothetical protein
MQYIIILINSKSMKRFIAYSAAVLLGLVSAQVPPAGDNNTPNL